MIGEGAKTIKVKLVYRNYKPLHTIYQSLVKCPPAGVEYVVPPINTSLRKLFPFYRKLRFFFIGRLVIRLVEGLVFLRKPKESVTVDLYHYVNMIDADPPELPYIVDIEHAAGLLSFTYNLSRLNEVKKFLSNPNCKAINCMSQAAKRTLEGLLEADYKAIAPKVNVVYPSLELPSSERLIADYRYIKEDPAKLKLLFVGNRAYLKGLEELVLAIKKINQEFSADQLEAHIISDDAGEIVDRYNLSNVFLYRPQFSPSEMMKQFYVPADVFLSPTKQDTYGMAVLDSLSCGTPVIATRQFAIPELVEDGVDGILLDVKQSLLDDATIPRKKDIDAIHVSNVDDYLVEQLVSVLRDIITGKIKLDILSGKGLDKFKPGGRFSAETRNEQLLRIYNETIL